MSLVYRVNTPITREQFEGILYASGLAERRPIHDAARLQRMLDHANLTLTAWDGERLVGIARALTDWSFCCYLSDLAVDKEYQRRGIGRELIERMQALIGEDVMLLLVSAPAAMDYYPHIGMEKMKRAWYVPRRS